MQVGRWTDAGCEERNRTCLALLGPHLWPLQEIQPLDSVRTSLNTTPFVLPGGPAEDPSGNRQDRPGQGSPGGEGGDRGTTLPSGQSSRQLSLWGTGRGCTS